MRCTCDLEISSNDCLGLLSLASFAVGWASTHTHRHSWVFTAHAKTKQKPSEQNNKREIRKANYMKKLK